MGVIALLLLISRSTHAADDPALVYWTIETKHFRIHYERGLEAAAVRVARHSEAIHERLVGPLGYAPSQRTEVLLSDVTDDSNGSASASPFNAVRLFITAPGDLSPLADHDDWYLSLMTHEYTHILHIDNVSGIPALVNAILGKTLTPNQFQPRWLIEGLAVVAESGYTSGGRIRASLFDMQLRADVLADNIAGLDQLSSSPRRWPFGTLYYLYGSRFLQWIVDVYGADVMRAVAADYGASLAPFGFNRAIRRQTGRTYEQLYEGFKDHIRRRYARQMKRVRGRGLREGRRLTFHGRSVFYPRFVPKRAREQGEARYQLAYFRNDLNAREGIYKLDLSEPAGGARESMWVRSNAPGPVSFDDAGNMLFSSVVPFKRVYRRTELFELEHGKTGTSGGEPWRRQLTKGLRATAPTVSPNGRHVVFTVNRRGTTWLDIADRSGDGELTNIRTLVSGQRFDQAFTPEFSPDGTKLAYSAWSAGGFRDIKLVDLASGDVASLTNDRAMDTNPTFSADGRKLYFSSDRTGIANIYELDLDTRKLRQVTNVRLGAVMPTVSEDGKLLSYVGYSHKGYDLWVMPLIEERFLEATPPRNDRPDPYGEPPSVPMKKFRYNPLPTLRPHAWTFDYAPGNFGSNALTISTALRDIVGHHAASVAVLADPEAELPMVSLDYNYGRLPVDLGVRLSNRVTPRTEYRLNDQRPQYQERSYGVRTSVSYSDQREFGSQSLALSYSASIIDSDPPLDQVGPLDPYAQPTREPLRGLITFVHAGYSYSNVEGGFDSAGSVRGLGLRIGLDVGDENLGSEESIYAGTYTITGYVPMPWPGFHTLAIRNAGGMAAGSYSRRGVFFVGGFNLENLSTLDALSSSVFDGAFVLRGYEPGSYSGSQYMLQNLEYRIPIVDIDHGISTLPIYLRRLSGNLFMDWGGAWDEFDFDDVEFFTDGAIVKSEDLHTSVGMELWLDATLAYGADFRYRFGYAYGFSRERVTHGQVYFLVSSSF